MKTIKNGTSLFDGQKSFTFLQHIAPVHRFVRVFNLTAPRIHGGLGMSAIGSEWNGRSGTFNRVVNDPYNHRSSEMMPTTMATMMIMFGVGENGAFTFHG